MISGEIFFSVHLAINLSSLNLENWLFVQVKWVKKKLILDAVCARIMCVYLTDCLTDGEA